MVKNISIVYNGVNLSLSLFQQNDWAPLDSFSKRPVCIKHFFVYYQPVFFYINISKINDK